MSTRQESSRLRTRPARMSDTLLSIARCSGDEGGKGETVLVVAVSIRTPALRRRHAAFPLALQRLRGLIAGS